MNSRDPIQVLLADDHTVVRQGLKALLDAESDIRVVADVETGRQAVQMTKRLRPHVVVMDFAMPSLNGLEATRQILKEVPEAKVLVLSSYSEDEYICQLTEAGAIGYLLKHTVAKELIKAIREAHQGRTYFSPAISRKLLDRYREVLRSGAPIRSRGVRLTTRQAEVLQLIAEGQPNKLIAAELTISIKTVEKYRQQVMNKLNIHDVAGLTRYAISKGIIQSSSGAHL